MNTTNLIIGRPKTVKLEDNSLTFLNWMSNALIKGMSENEWAFAKKEYSTIVNDEGVDKDLMDILLYFNAHMELSEGENKDIIAHIRDMEHMDEQFPEV